MNNFAFVSIFQAVSPNESIQGNSSRSRFVSPLSFTRSHPKGAIHGQSKWYKRSHSVNLQKTEPYASKADLENWAEIDQQRFDHLMASGRLQFCFVGMSNCGKSFRSEQLSTAKEFERLCVDQEIEAAIKPELSALGYSGIDGMAEWMGFPSDPRFAKNEKRYLEHEERITSSVVPCANRNFVLDTTGSVVYLSKTTLQQLRRMFLVVHLVASDEMLEYMTNNYFDTPKPVVWGDAFEAFEGEDPESALRRCYPFLLRERRKRYGRLAHVSIPASVSISPNVNVDQFLQKIRLELKDS